MNVVSREKQSVCYLHFGDKFSQKLEYFRMVFEGMEIQIKGMMSCF